MPQVSHTPRYPKCYFSPTVLKVLHKHTPWVALWWSAALPGLGHIYLGKYFIGIILILWEVVVNMNANINLAILYSFTGQYDVARELLDQRLTLLYCTVYVFTMWDSYRGAVETNRLAVLAEQEPLNLSVIRIDAFEIHYLDKLNPWMAAVWSLLMPGLGHLYTHRLLVGTFILLWWASIVYLSNLLPGVFRTAIGDFAGAASTLCPCWLIFLPSVYGFSAWDAYMSAVENNKLFRREQSEFLRKEFLADGYDMPI